MGAWVQALKVAGWKQENASDVVQVPESYRASNKWNDAGRLEMWEHLTDACSGSYL